MAETTLRAEDGLTPAQLRLIKVHPRCAIPGDHPEEPNSRGRGHHDLLQRLAKARPRLVRDALRAGSPDLVARFDKAPGTLSDRYENAESFFTNAEYILACYLNKNSGQPVHHSTDIGTTRRILSAHKDEVETARKKWRKEEKGKEGEKVHAKFGAYFRALKTFEGARLRIERKKAAEASEALATRLQSIVNF